jgi:Ser/Thr protein kinase RdoA (MazF antagonist)
MKSSSHHIPESVLEAFELSGHHWQVQPYGTGLINRTWKLDDGKEAYILQRVNQQVFRNPDDIAHNMQLLSTHLSQAAPDYLFVAPLPTRNGQMVYYAGNDGYFRLFPFIRGSHTVDVVHTPEQAFEAARQFGRFTRLLEGLDVRKLHITIPSFHDLTLRYQQLLRAIETGHRERVKASEQLIGQLIGYSGLVSRFEQIRQNPDFLLRVIHHDTKISNVLFDNNGKGLCVIDLDTVMPGYFISDLGDMFRTYLCPVSEEEKEEGRIEVRENFFRAILDGYLSEMQSILSQAEREHLFYAGQFMIYMQAIRFLTDHLMGDTYYGAAYPGHNYYRARNQYSLLHRYSAMQGQWE